MGEGGKHPVFDWVRDPGKQGTLFMVDRFLSGNLTKHLGITSPFFPGILFSRKPPETQGKRPVFGKNDG